MLEGYPLSYLGYGSAETVHAMVEAMRHAYVDRNTALGDPDFVDNPVEKLSDKAYAKEIRDKINPFKAGISQELMPKGFAESKETTHYSIVDDEGNAVAVTYTLNGSFGAGVVAPGTGILLNNEMDDFTAKPGVPNLYGLVQGEANAIAPKKTPLSSMSPTILSKDGKPFMVIGSPGGARIITITLEAIVNVIDHGMNIQEAIDAPRIHHQWLPDKVYMEPYALSAGHGQHPHRDGPRRRHRRELDDLGRGRGHPCRRRESRRYRGWRRRAVLRRDGQPRNRRRRAGLLMPRA